mgnify:CR=1 FL=1|jgi:predicted CXXCH cytochrome family protein
MVALVFVARWLVVPKDFGVWESGYMYGWHDKADEQFWKDFTVKYRGRSYCQDCHPRKLESIMFSKHASIQCENCHGPALEHPSAPQRLEIDRSRDFCLRCHALLPYPTSLRGQLRGIKAQEHFPQHGCSTCHNPHRPDLEAGS